MPIGIYFPSTNVFEELADSGFNLIVGPPNEKVLDRADAAGLSVLIHAARGRFETSEEREKNFKRLDRHPATWGWYLTDEPDLNQISPARMKAEHRDFRRFARKRTMMVLASGGSVEKYRGTADWIGVDWYPIPWSSVGTVAREMRLARLGADGRPFMAVIQAFDWSSAREMLRTDEPLRPPIYAEIRSMAYLALMQGANGLLFYAYRDAGIDIETNPELRKAVLKVAAEIRENSHVFGTRLKWWPAHTEYHGEPEMMYNEVEEGRMSLALFRSSQGFYMMLANTTAEPVEFSLKLPISGVSELKTFCADDAFEANDGWLRKTYGPFEVCILGPMKGVLADE
jgi:hypothetical protein